MKKKFFDHHILFFFPLIILLIINGLLPIGMAQIIVKNDVDSVRNWTIDSLNQVENRQISDSILQDSSKISPKPTKKLSPNAVTATVIYKSLDSAIFDIKNRSAYLFNEGTITYEDMELAANFVSMGFSNSELYASGVASEEGNVGGHPVFTQDGTAYRAQEIRYNFLTKKGKITKVITSEGEGYVHGKIVKKINDTTLYIRHGKYTTCDLDDPHFEISFTKGKYIKDDKIVTGPAYISFGGVPTFLATPFAYFPMDKGRRSGIVMPTYGELPGLGFYLQDFGYYIPIKNNMDLLLSGTIYTRGSWGLKARSNYVFRYICNGIVELSFTQTFEGESRTPERRHTNDFKIYWSHNQDPKLHPTTRFNAHVNVISKSYTRKTVSSIDDYLSNQFSSSLNLSTNANGIFYFDAAITYSQNTGTHMVDMSLPDMNMSVIQFYPFRKKNKIGTLKWYDNISMKWSARSGFRLSGLDSLFLKPQTWNDINVGMSHNIPITIPIKISKAINWNTSLTFSENWYMQHHEKVFYDSLGGRAEVVRDTFKRQFGALHDLNISSSLTTRVYFIYQARKGVAALRHVMTPTLNFMFRPRLNYNMEGSYINTTQNREIVYSYYDRSMYGAFGKNMQAVASFNISNNVECKIRSKRDTITGTRKIVLLENLTLNAGYDFAADSLKWQMFTISGRTTLFKQLYITFQVAFDPYIIGSNGSRINVTALKAYKKLVRFSNANVALGLNWTINQELFQKTKKKKEEPEKTETNATSNGTIFTENSLGMPNRRPDFSNPWAITFNYTFAYNVSDNMPYYRDRKIAPKPYNNQIIQTLNVSADFSITKKWKIGLTTGYDFSQRDLSFTSIDIYRDLHCWEMRFNWIPFGYRKGWSFTINVKASVLQDLKYNMKRDFRNNLR